MRCFLPLVFLVYFVSPAWGAVDSDCPPFEEPAIDVRPQIIRPRIDNTRNLHALMVMAKESSDQFSSARKEIPIGLTASALTMTTHYKILMQDHPMRRTSCAQISSLTLSFGFPDTTVYLAREIPYNSCGYQEVLEHELTHVAIDRALVRDALPHLTQELERFVRQLGVIRSNSPEEARGLIEDHVNAFIRRWSQELSSLRHEKQNDFDSPEEYERLTLSCEGELGEMVRQFK